MSINYRKQFKTFEDRVFDSLPESPWNDLIQEAFDKLNDEYDRGIKEPKNWAKDFCVEYQKLGLDYKNLIVYVDLHKPSLWKRIKKFLVAPSNRLAEMLGLQSDEAKKSFSKLYFGTILLIAFVFSFSLEV